MKKRVEASRKARGDKKSPDRAARLKMALKDNVRRRKEQARARRASEASEQEAER